MAVYTNKAAMGTRKRQGSPAYATLAPYSHNRLKIYSLEEIEHCERSKTIAKYLSAKKIQSPNTAVSHKTRLQAFSQFVFKKFDKGMEVDDLIEELRNGKGKLDPYDVLTEFAGFLTNERVSKLSANVIRNTVKTTKKFFRFSKVNVTNEDFKDLVPLPKKQHPIKIGLEKTDVTDFLNACKNIRLKTAIMGIPGSGGPRPIELFALRERDVDLKSSANETVTFRAEYDKVRHARKRPITKEWANQLRLWLNFKYRTRTRKAQDPDGSESYEQFTPERDPNNLLLAHLHFDESVVTPDTLYGTIQEEFGELVDLIGRGEREAPGKRRQITLNRLRSWTKTTYSNLGNKDFGEYMMGHTGSDVQTYYRVSDKEIWRIFRQLEPYFTFLDAKQLDASTADIKAKNEALENTVLKLQQDLRTAQGYQSSFEQVITFLKQKFPDNTKEIDELTTNPSK